MTAVEKTSCPLFEIIFGLCFGCKNRSYEGIVCHLNIQCPIGGYSKV